MTPSKSAAPYRWDADRHVWRTMSGGVSEVNWPTAGVMRGGVVTCSAAAILNRKFVDGLLGTPQARDWKGVPGKRFNVGNLPGQVQAISENWLPTPKSSDSMRGNTPSERLRRTLSMVAVTFYYDPNSSQWGKYAEAVARWEKLTRPAPDPVGLSRNGNVILNPAFSEWMMGWPKGWVTDLINPQAGKKCGEGFISRADAMKMIGNGVVTQQAAAAITLLKQSLEDERRVI